MNEDLNFAIKTVKYKQRVIQKTPHLNLSFFFYTGI